MSENLNCPKCQMANTYFDGMLNLCPDCNHEWSDTQDSASATKTPKDSNGTELLSGDSVTVTKDLKVKGSSMVVKRGTKVKNVRLTDNSEEVDCKVDGIAITLKTCFLKKES